MSKTDDFVEIYKKMIPRILKVSICSLRGEAEGDENRSLLTVYPIKPSNYECMEIEQIKATGTITVTWGENRAVMRPNKTGAGYHSFLYTSLREDAAANEHATLDDMIERVCEAKWK